ncbi:MAG: DUF1738 domain-containing protein [Methyloprofundus sp.]|nr:DUF1738 domain-containing protein [Methyloprofundus sp.]
MSHKDLFKDLVNEIISLMESDDLNWSKPFRSVKHQNPVSGSIYRGINPFILALKAYREGWDEPYWLTFNQAKKLGLKIKKGATTTPVFFYSLVEKEDEKTGEKNTFPVFKSYRVFNIQQMDGVVHRLPKKVELIGSLKVGYCRPVVDAFIDNTGADIITSDKAAYSPIRDKVMMPAPGLFNSEESYYATLLHEIAHWTGHKSRLNREGITDHSAVFGSEKYAFEELIAELSAVFLCSHLGVEKGGVDQNHAAYIKHWIKGLKEDPMSLWKAAAKAQAVFDYLCEQQK